jgi:hypothetical protein
MSPHSTDGRRCFRATMAAGAGEAILATVGLDRGAVERLCFLRLAAAVRTSAPWHPWHRARRCSRFDLASRERNLSEVNPRGRSAVRFTYVEAPAHHLRSPPSVARIGP